MSGDEPFLARWLRRKRNVAAQASPQKDPAPPSVSEPDTSVSPAAGNASPAMPLPPIESIVSASDIRAFLAPDVPLELTRAALRRAWSVDPAIRDFTGLSENAWDFNAPGGVPGFGSLDVQDVRRLLARVVGGPEVADPARDNAAPADHSTTPAAGAPAVSIAQPTQSIAAVQHEDNERKAREFRPRPHHGGALPQ
jgi:Protein of unknown function (DUF3306)